MDRISAFISYSSAQKSLGGKFKLYLSSFCGYEIFIAHDDIPGSSVWEEEIIGAIKKSDFFIPLISQAFIESPFTDQETGMAVYLKKKIIPIKLDSVNPYGFISKFQAIPYKDDMKELALTIAQVGLSYGEPYRQKVLDSAVYAFCNSSSFEKANAAIGIICKCKDLSRNHLKQITEAIKINTQIQGAFELHGLRKFLLETYRIVID